MNITAEKQEKLEAEAKPGTEGTVHQKLYYSQGMNLFAGIFLYVLPEPLAFWAFTKFMEEMCPRYGGSIEGAKEGLMVCVTATTYHKSSINLPNSI